MSNNLNYQPNILSINNYHYRRGGSDAVYFDHDSMFSNKNWNTASFSMHHSKNEETPWSDYFVNELEFGNTYSLYQKLIMAGKVIYSFEAKNNLNNLLDKFRPDIAHLHCIYHHLSPSVLDLLREREIPSVMTAHDLKLACPAYKMLNKNGICEKCKDGNLLHLIKNRCIHNSISISSLIALESAFHKTFKLYKKNLNAVVTPSIFFLEKLKEWGWEEDKLTYIPNFIDSNSVVPNYEAGKYFLYFGRLAPEKGVDTLINAIKKTKSKLIIAGTGPYESALKSIVLDYQNISFVGFKSGKDLWDLIHNSRAVILPSEWYENAPISVLEAYAGGKPVIGANIGGIPEMLKHGDTGFIFESGNEDDLADKISTCIELEDKKLTSIGKNAREYVTSTFNPDRYYNDMTNLYYSLGVKKI